MRDGFGKEFAELFSKNKEIIDTCVFRKQAKKNEFILSEGESAFVALYLNEGLTRNFMLNEGKEITLQFNFPGDIVFPLNSYRKNLKSDEFIQALTDIDFIKINLNDFESIKHKHIDLYKLELKINEIYTFQIAKRLRNFQIKTAKQRYLDLINNEPKIIQFCQLSHIASYLGINLGSLSRIRGEI